MARRLGKQLCRKPQYKRYQQGFKDSTVLTLSQMHFSVDVMLLHGCPNVVRALGEVFRVSKFFDKSDGLRLQGKEPAFELLPGRRQEGQELELEMENARTHHLRTTKFCCLLWDIQDVGSLETAFRSQRFWTADRQYIYPDLGCRLLGKTYHQFEKCQLNA